MKDYIQYQISGEGYLATARVYKYYNEVLSRVSVDVVSLVRQVPSQTLEFLVKATPSRTYLKEFIDAMVEGARHLSEVPQESKVLASYDWEDL